MASGDAEDGAVDKQEQKNDDWKAARLKRIRKYQWKKGASGNPKGRPKGITISEAYRIAISQLVPRDPRGRSFAEKIGEAIASKAAKGDIRCAEEIANRLEGKPVQALTGAGGSVLFPVSREGAVQELTKLLREVQEKFHVNVNGTV